MKFLQEDLKATEKLSCFFIPSQERKGFLSNCPSKGEFAKKSKHHQVEMQGKGGAVNNRDAGVMVGRP